MKSGWYSLLILKTDLSPPLFATAAEDAIGEVPWWAGRPVVTLLPFGGWGCNSKDEKDVLLDAARTISTWDESPKVRVLNSNIFQNPGSSLGLWQIHLGLFGKLSLISKWV